MKLSALSALWLLPPLFLAGCTHKTAPVQNQSLAPVVAKPVPPATTPVELPASDTTIPTQPTENATAPTQPTKPPARQRRPATPAPAAPAQAANPQPAPSAPPAVSAIGELSSGDAAQVRHQTEDTIASTEHDLNSINRTLSSAEQATADHIREFLKQARASLGSGDMDGAHTLAMKAQVLLSELKP